MNHKDYEKFDKAWEKAEEAINTCYNILCCFGLMVAGFAGLLMITDLFGY